MRFIAGHHRSSHSLRLLSTAFVFLFVEAGFSADPIALRINDAFCWTSPTKGSQNSLGYLSLCASKATLPKIDSKREISVQPASGAITFGSYVASRGGTAIHLNFQSATGPVTVDLVFGSDYQNVGSVDISSDELHVRTLQVAQWPDLLRPETINIPYYSGHIQYLPINNNFANIYLDWQNSNGSTFSGNSATYHALTDHSYRKLHERILFRTSVNFDDVLPDIRNPKSPFLAQLSGRLVLDIWGPDFSQIRRTVSDLQQWGLNNCVVIIHSWQAHGYDNALPAHLPANSALGGNEELRAAIGSAKNSACYVALHQNYSDYYPNYEYFTSSAIALDSDGNQQKGWLNQATGIQALLVKPSLYLANARPESERIHRELATSASFIDGLSSVPPWTVVDMDASVHGAGMFSEYYLSASKLWSFERTANDGPVFGEGDNHWFWSGLLDGVEAQFDAADIPLYGPDQPLFVDFDLLKIHPLQVNHGMGYYSRWLNIGQDIHQTALLDAYRMQEVIFGHAPYVGAELWDSVPRMLIEQGLVGSVASRYGASLVKSIQYQVNGEWADTNESILRKDWSRPKVQYLNGDTIVANNRSQVMIWQGIQIPFRGWMAAGKDLIAYTALKQGHIIDFAETSERTFANARNQMDLRESDLFATIEGADFNKTMPRTLQASMKWRVGQKTPAENLKLFIHVVPVNSFDAPPAFQADRWPAIPTSQWKRGQSLTDGFSVSIPEGVKDGEYSVLIGLYSTKSGQRVVLSGHDMGAHRYALGTLKIGASGSLLIFTSQPALVVQSDSRLNSEGATIDFGDVKTDGLVFVKRQNKSWSAYVFPSFRPVFVNLKSSRFPIPNTVSCHGGGNDYVYKPELKDSFWQLVPQGAENCSWMTE